MDADQGREIYLFACTIWGRTPSDGEAVAWAKVLEPGDARQVQQALIDLSREGTDYWPQPGKLLAALRPPEGSVVHGEDGRMFLPGTGWVDTPKSLADRSLELEAPLDPEVAALKARGVRASIAEAKAATSRRREVDEEARAEIRARVDAAAARLRMPEEEQADA